MKTAAESEAAGKAARRRLPRSTHGDWSPSPGRDDPVAILRRQDESRVPELLAIRHGRMAASAFTFYRGAAAIMAADLGAGSRTELAAQLCGDAHLSNFGAFAAPDRRLVFDINDFDETHPGPFEWDVKRLGASFAVAGRDLGFTEAQRRPAVAMAAGEYRREIRRLAAMRTIDVWYTRVDLELVEQYRSRVPRKVAKRYDKAVAKAERKNSLRALERLTEQIDGAVRLVSDPPLIVRVEELLGGEPADRVLEALDRLLAEYRRTLDVDIRRLAERYSFVDAARKVVGVGSVGMRAWIVLLLGRDANDPLFLQAKEAESSVLEPYTGRARFKHPGRRVVEGQRLMQAASDIFLGWLSTPDADGVERHYFVRQLWDGKGSADLSNVDPKRLALYARLCGGTLARAHARSGDRIAIASYLGKAEVFDDAICDFAESYAEQNESDFARFTEAIRNGALTAELGI